MAVPAEWAGEALRLAPRAAAVEEGRAAAVDAGWRGKRAFDVAVAAFLVVLLAPLIVLVMVAVKLTSRGPVFFRQRRVGRGGSEFGMLKFRTMHVGAEERLNGDASLFRLYVDGSHKIPSHLDPRVTRLGRLLRVWSVDELPQLLNVLAGHMSLVGPRPVRPEELPEYGAMVVDYLALRPGLTGLWQVGGRNLVRFPARARMDTRYRVECGPWTDLRILARTPAAVLLRRGSE